MTKSLRLINRNNLWIDDGFGWPTAFQLVYFYLLSLRWQVRWIISLSRPLSLQTFTWTPLEICYTLGHTMAK